MLDPSSLKFWLVKFTLKEPVMMFTDDTFKVATHTKAHIQVATPGPHIWVAPSRSISESGRSDQIVSI